MARACARRALGLACFVLCVVYIVAAEVPCHNPLPNATYNKFIPDMTEVPLVMSVSLQPVIITDISPRTQTFTLIGYLFMGWTDRRLAFDKHACNNGKERYVLTGSDMSLVWGPQLEFPNSKGRSINPEEVNVWDSGFALYVGRIQLELHADLDVSRFPFDSHTLSVTVEEFDHPTPELVLVADDKAKLATFESSQFVFDDDIVITKHLFAVPQRNTTWDQVTFSVTARRMWASTFVNTIMPVTMIVGMAICAFMLPRQESTSRVSICITAFLSAIAFSVTLQSTLPPVRYITRMSIFIVMSFSTTFACLLASVAVGVLYNAYKKKHQDAHAKKKKKVRESIRRATLLPMSTRLRAGSGAASPRGRVRTVTSSTNPVHSSTIEMSERVRMAGGAPAAGAVPDDGAAALDTDPILLDDLEEVERLHASCGRGTTSAQKLKKACNLIDSGCRYVLPVLYIGASFLVFNA